MQLAICSRPTASRSAVSDVLWIHALYCGNSDITQDNSSGAVILADVGVAIVF